MKHSYHLWLSIALFWTYSATAQVNLKPSIGIGALPADSDTICGYPIPQNPDMTFMSGGFNAEDTIADFTFYDLNGNAQNMANLLDQGKPVLIVSLNYTCPYVRNQVTTYHDVLNTYGNDINMIGVYILEAHPEDDYSPNSGNWGSAQANVNAGILYNQHNTYGDRKQVAQDFTDSMHLQFPFYMDGPCNEWWNAFGPGPAMGYIINTDGTVFTKHGWFDKESNGHDIYCDLDSLLGNPCNSTNPYDGQFSFNMMTQSIYGSPTDIILAEGELVNSSTGDVEIDIIRQENNMPNGWTSAICADICLAQTDDSTRFVLPAGQTQSYHMYFYTNQAPNNGNTKMLFKNANDPTNTTTEYFYGYTDATGIGSIESGEYSGQALFPNPVAGNLLINLQQELLSGTGQLDIEFFDLTGRRVFASTNLKTSSLQLSEDVFSKGIYSYRIYHSEQLVDIGKLVVQ